MSRYCLSAPPPPSPSPTVRGRSGLRWLVLSLVLLTASCAPVAPAPPTPTATLAPTWTPVPTTPAPTLTPSLTPTPRPSPTATLTPTPAPRRVSLDLRVAARRAPIIMQVDEANLEGDALTLQLQFFNMGLRDLQSPTFASGGDAVLVADGAPQSPRDVTPSLLHDIGPQGQWNVGAANRGALIFDRPRSDAATLRLPGFPPVQIDFRAGSAMALAEDGGPLPTPTPNTASQALVELRNVVKQIQAAVRARDESAFRTPIAPAALAAFGDPNDPFAFARAVPFSRFDLELFTADLGSAGRVERDARGQLVAVRGALVSLGFAFQGVESEWFRQLLTVDFERTAVGWQITRIEPDRPPFWAKGLTAYTRSPHFLAFHRPTQDVGEILDAAEQAHAALVEQLGDLVDPVSVIVVADTRDLFTALTQQDGHSYVGSARFDNLLTTTGIVVVSRALYINDAAFTVGDLANTRLQTIQHELTHLALARWSRPWTPPWVVEGAAGVFSGEANFPALDAFVRDNGLARLSLADLTGLDSLEQSRVPLTVSYPYSTIVSQTIIDQFGLPRYLDFYKSFADVPMDRVRQAAGGEASVSLERFRGLQRAVTEEKLKSVLGLTVDDLEVAAEGKMRARIGK